MEIALPRLGCFIIAPFAATLRPAVGGVDVGGYCKKVHEPRSQVRGEHTSKVFEMDIDVLPGPVGAEFHDMTPGSERIVLRDNCFVAEE